MICPNETCFCSRREGSVAKEEFVLGQLRTNDGFFLSLHLHEGFGEDIGGKKKVTDVKNY